MSLSQEVLEVTRRYLNRVKKTGAQNIMAACPFHVKADGSEERNPSFTMSLTNGLYFCFACKEKGNLRQFLERVGIPPFVLEKQYGILIEETSKRIPPKFDPLRPELEQLTLPEATLGLFDFCPIDLLNEGFQEEVLQDFDVGFDKHHMRITFPLRDLEGRLVGISGRTVTGTYPRYKIYNREYEIYDMPAVNPPDKRRLLWNAHRVYPAIYPKSNMSIFVVEGFKACMWLHQAGITEVVALLGSYLSLEQKWILERIGATVYLMLDNGEAGQRGTEFIGRALAKSLSVKVVSIPSDRAQPTDLSHDEVHAAVEQAADYYLWRLKGEQHGV